MNTYIVNAHMDEWVHNNFFFVLIITQNKALLW